MLFRRRNPFDSGRGKRKKSVSSDLTTSTFPLNGIEMTGRGGNISAGFDFETVVMLSCGEGGMLCVLPAKFSGKMKGTSLISRESGILFTQRDKTQTTRGRSRITFFHHVAHLNFFFRSLILCNFPSFSHQLSLM